MVRQQKRLLTLLLTLLLISGQIIPTFAQESGEQDSSAQANTATPIRIGSKEFNEQLLLGKMMLMVLQDAGYVVEDKTALGGSRAVRDALVNGEIDIYPEYTGTALTLYNGLPADALPNTADRSYELVKSLDNAQGLVWLNQAEINNTFTLMVRDELFTKGVQSLADLAVYMNGDGADLKVCVESEFFSRDDGLPGLQKLYGFAFKEENVLVMEPNETYDKLRQAECDVAEGFATDGRIGAWGFHNLEDTLAFFPFYHPAPVIRQPVLDTNPEIADLLNNLWQYLDNETMIALNARVDIGADGILANGDEESVDDVAYNFLVSKRIVQPEPIKVGSKEFNEQLLLGQMMIILLRESGYAVEDLTGYGGTTAIREAVEAGEIDLYPEYTGTATSVHHNIPTSALPTDAERSYMLAKTLDAAQGLVWLDPAPLNNTYTLMVRQELVDEGIKSIDDLAVYMNANDSSLTLCVESEFYARPDGLPGLQELYGFTFNDDNILLLEASETYAKLRSSECDVAEGYATDGRINAWGFTNLEDTLAFFPFYNPTPVLRAEVLARYPALTDLLNNWSKLLDGPTMSALNARVDIGADGELNSGDEESVEEVAYSFLRANRLIPLPPIAVSAANTTEGYQQVLSQMVMLLLADAGYRVVDKSDLGGSLLVRQAMLDSEVDIYLESVATVLTEYNDLPLTALPTGRERAYMLAQTLDQPLGITWLNPLPYTEAYGIVAQDAVIELAIQDLDDLAAYMNANDAPFSICMGNEFYASKQRGILALEELYDFVFNPDNILLMDDTDLNGAFAAGDCDLAALPLDVATDDLTALTDSRNFFLVLDTAPVVRAELLAQNPELAELLNRLVAALDSETAEALDQAIEVGEDGIAANGDEASPAEAALEFLRNAGLVNPDLTLDILVPSATDDATTSPARNSGNTRATPANGATDSATGGTEEVAPATPTPAPTPTAAPTDEGAADDNATGQRNPTGQNNATEGGEVGATPASPQSPTLAQTNPAASTDGADASAADSIRVASMADPEQYLLGQLLVAMLRSGGYNVIDQTGSGSSPDLRSQLEQGQIDLYPEFTGAALLLYHNIPLAALPTDPERAFELIKNLDRAFNITWIRKAAFDSAYGLAASEALVNEDVQTLADLGALLGADNRALTLCVEPGFLDDPANGAQNLASLYGITFAEENIELLPLAEIYSALRNGDCDVAQVARTDGRIDAWNLYVLEDTLGAFPNYTPAPVMRNELLTRYPELEGYLGDLGPLLNTAVMTELNARVALGADGESATGDEVAAAEVATTFLCDNGLIGDCGNPVAVAQAVTVTTVATTTVSTAPLSTTTALTSALALTTATAITADGILPYATLIPIPAATIAPTTTPEAVTTITVSTPDNFGVNARSTANTSATVVAVLPSNSVVQATGRTADNIWLQVVLPDGQVAWVFTAAVLTRSENVVQLPVVAGDAQN